MQGKVIHMIIPESFCGYLTHNDERFVYTVSNQYVTLLSTKDDMRGRIDSVERIINSTEELPVFLYAEDNGFPVAFMRKSAYRHSPISLNSALRFSTPLIIMAAGNADGFFNELTMPWNKFHAITFVGGNINALSNPQIAIQKQSKDDEVYRDGSNEIKVLPWNDYSRSIDLSIGGEKTTLTISVKQTGGKNDKERKGTFVLGELNTFIRFSFDQAKKFASIEKYYVIAKSLYLF